MRMFNKIFRRQTPEADSRSAVSMPPTQPRLTVRARRPAEVAGYRTSAQMEAILKIGTGQIQSGRYRTMLYRFLTDQVPLVGACIWTWSRLAAAPGAFKVTAAGGEASEGAAAKRLARLADQIAVNAAGQPCGLTPFLVDLFAGLFRDGVYGGFLTVNKDISGIERFVPIDVAHLRLSGPPDNRRRRLVYEHDRAELDLNRPDFYHLALDDGHAAPLGRSILGAIPFVSYIEQQLIDDMRRSSHNAGFHRLHVKITPPERMPGEADNAYVDRINHYFDSTVSMIKSCDVDDNPVTWNNVAIETIGPESSLAVSNRWYLNHRAMVEEICAGTHLAPFLLGYAYGATQTWAGFKFDLVMRQVRTVQAQVARFLKWIGDIELALAGLNAECEYVFDNNFAYQASDQAAVESRRLDNLLKLYQAGLIDEVAARDVARQIL